MDDQVRLAFCRLAEEGVRRHIMDHKDWDHLIEGFLEGLETRMTVEIALGPTDALLARSLLGMETPEEQRAFMHQEAHRLGLA